MTSATAPPPRRILLADDHPLVRNGWRLIIREAGYDAEFGEAGDSASALALAEREPWDIVLLDISMPGANGIEVLKNLRVLRPTLPVLIVSLHPEELFAVRAFRAGAAGYLVKNAEAAEFLRAFETVLAGRKYVSERMASQLASNLGPGATRLPHERLTDREQEVLMLIAAGLENREIAATLHLSPKTISTHREHILAKMGLRTNAALILYAVRHGLVG